MTLPTTLRWLVTSETLLPLPLALPVAERVRRTVKGRLARLLGAVPAALHDHAPGGGPPRGDPHPFYLAEDADEDGAIDHLVLHAPQGLDPAWLDRLDRLVPAAEPAGPLPRFALTADWLGGRATPAAPGALLGAARAWRSVTPYVADIHLKPRFGPAEALARDLRRYGLEAAIRPVPGLDCARGTLSPATFVTTRGAGERRQAISAHPGAFFTLDFPKPVLGPMAVGFACHLGLGLFRRAHGVLAL